VYYRIYTEDGAIISKQPADSSGDLSLGRIDIDTITPPHTIASIKLRIAKAEQLGKASGAKLFTNILSESPMDATRVLILTGDRPGSNAENPMVYVHSKSVQLRAVTSAGQSKFDLGENALLTIIYFSGWACYSGWLSITLGEILCMDSDCVMKPQLLCGWRCQNSVESRCSLLPLFCIVSDGNITHDAYTVVNGAGTTGCEPTLSLSQFWIFNYTSCLTLVSRLYGYVSLIHPQCY
jgi:hypothetical protein